MSLKIDPNDLRCSMTYLRDDQFAFCVPCLHSDSKIALEKWVREKPTCPRCRAKIEKIVSTKEMGKEIQRMQKAYCQALNIQAANRIYLKENPEEKRIIEDQRIGHYPRLESGDLSRLFSETSEEGNINLDFLLQIREVRALAFRRERGIIQAFVAQDGEPGEVEQALHQIHQIGHRFIAAHIPAGSRTTIYRENKHFHFLMLKTSLLAISAFGIFFFLATNFSSWKDTKAFFKWD